MGRLCPSEMIHQEIRTFESSPCDRRVRHFRKIFPANGLNVEGSIERLSSPTLDRGPPAVIRLLHLQRCVQWRLARRRTDNNLVSARQKAPAIFLLIED
jgi:hypothetical protein